MSFGPGGYPALDIDAPDADREVICIGCKRLTVQISNQAVYITFGVGTPPQYGQAEPFLPLVGEIPVAFDAFKVRAYTPLAQLGGNPQAHVKLIPRTR